MAEHTISSYFEDPDGPLVGLTPSIRIWEVGSSNSLIVGTPCGIGLATDGIMTEIEDCGSPASSHDGFYKYTFSDSNGYDPSKTYLIRVDAGSSVPNAFRYQTANIEPSLLDTQKSDHLISGSVGETIAQIKADTTNIIDNLYLNVDSVKEIVHLLFKMEAGRTKIDPQTSTLTIYDTDCSTILRTFKLYDSQGNENVINVCERKPVIKGAGDTSSISTICP